MEEIVGQAIDPAAAVGSTATFEIYHLCPLSIIQDFLFPTLVKTFAVLNCLSGGMTQNFLLSSLNELSFWIFLYRKLMTSCTVQFAITTVFQGHPRLGCGALPVNLWPTSTRNLSGQKKRLTGPLLKEEGRSELLVLCQLVPSGPFTMFP